MAMKKFLGTMPTWAVAFVGACWFVNGAYFSKVFYSAGLNFLLALNSAPFEKWNVTAWCGLLLVAYVGVMAWFGVSAALACNGVLKDRLFR